jgi:hypothetical protein
VRTSYTKGVFVWAIAGNPFPRQIGYPHIGVTMFARVKIEKPLAKKQGVTLVFYKILITKILPSVAFEILY